MAKFDVLDMNGKKVSTVELSDAVFGITPNEKVMHAAVVNFLANQRQGTQSTKTRSEVSGGGRKPWRQKGTETVVNMLTAIGADKKALIVTPAVDAKLVKSAANIPGVKTATADSINTYEVLNGGKFVISVDAAKKLEEVFA